MEKIVSFIVDNWKLIAELCAAIFCLVMFLVRKKPVNSVSALLYELCLSAVKQAEKTTFKGADKMDYALDFVAEFVRKQYPDLDFNRYVALCEHIIENILSTPQKKGEK